MFTFNFMPDDEAGDASKDVPNQSQTEACLPEVTENQSSSAGDDDVVPVSHPFVWKDGLESLLDDRAQQEIVFQEIELSSNVKSDGSDDDHTTPQPPLRRVCMDQYEKEVTPGVYEGGLQVWECSLDLVRHFQENNLRLLEGQSALELGCGHALPGCWLLREALVQEQQQQQQQQKQHQQSAASPSSFQIVFVDYNDYVIDDVTISNIVLNTAGIVPAQTLAKRNLIQLGSGDWKDMSRRFPENNRRRFDWIIAAETTYTPQAAKDTAQLLLNHLTIDTGIGWIASKRYYFGVGGGTDALREAAQQLSTQSVTDEQQQYYLQVETVRVLDNGVGNIREILKVTCHVEE